jgi:hypothetical protein
LWYNAGKQKYTSNGNTSDGAKIMNLYLRSGAGYFVLANLAAGLALNLDYYREKGDTQDGGGSYEYTNKNTSFYVGPFLRYYFWQWNALMFYGEALFAFGVYNSIYKALSESQTKESLLRAHLLLGVSFFVVQRLAFDLAMGYQWTRYKEKELDYITKYNRFMACLGIVFFLGQNGGYKGIQQR